MATVASALDHLPTNAMESLSAPGVPKNPAIADRVAALLAHPSEIRFKDFEDPNCSTTWAIQDYCNVFVPLYFVAQGLDLEISLKLLKKIRKLWVPNVDEYFCAKAFSSGVSMEAEGLEVWRSAPSSTRTSLSNILYERHFSGFDKSQTSIVRLIEEDAQMLNLMLTSGWPDESDKNECLHYIEILGTIAARATRRMRILDNPKLMQQEIECSKKP